MQEGDKEIMAKYYNKEGKELTLFEWIEKNEDVDYKRIALDKLDKYKVSTVWLGLDHNFSNEKKLIFETMVFKDNDEVDCERYSTEKEAIEGHKAMVKKWKARR